VKQLEEEALVLDGEVAQPQPTASFGSAAGFPGDKTQSTAGPVGSRPQEGTPVSVD
jgi:hypothetical protein